MSAQGSVGFRWGTITGPYHANFSQVKTQKFDPHLFYCLQWECNNLFCQECINTSLASIMDFLGNTDDKDLLLIMRFLIPIKWCYRLISHKWRLLPQTCWHFKFNLCKQCFFICVFVCAGLSLALYIYPSIYPFAPSIYLILMHRTCTTICFVLCYLYTYTINVHNIDMATNYVLCYRLDKTHVWTIVLLQLTLISGWMNNHMLSYMWDVINNHTRSFEKVGRNLIWKYVINRI